MSTPPSDAAAPCRWWWTTSRWPASGLRCLLARDPEVEVVGECANGREAVAALRRAAPGPGAAGRADAGVDGFEVLAGAGPRSVPGRGVRDGLRQLRAAGLRRRARWTTCSSPSTTSASPGARARASSTCAAPRVQAAGAPAAAAAATRRCRAAARAAGAAYIERLAVKEAGARLFVRVEEIDWVEAEDNYVQVHVGGKIAPAARDAAGAGGAAGPAALPAHPPLRHREPGPRAGGAAPVPRRVLGACCTTAPA